MVYPFLIYLIYECCSNLMYCYIIIQFNVYAVIKQKLLTKKTGMTKTQSFHVAHLHKQLSPKPHDHYRL